MTSTQPTKYDFRVNPVYQVDFATQCKGKRVVATKRTVRFRFGFSNAQAIVEGHTGNECRGEEHEVYFVWSLTSGKRQLFMDDQEIHYSKGGRTETSFETSWSITGGHIMKIKVYAAPPLRPTPGFRQFELTLDGCSYFDMPKIYELGTKRSNRLVNRGHVSSTSQEYETQFALPPTPARVTPPSSPREDALHSSMEMDLLSLQSSPTPSSQYSNEGFSSRNIHYQDTSSIVSTPTVYQQAHPGNHLALANEPHTFTQPAVQQPHVGGTDQNYHAYAQQQQQHKFPQQQGQYYEHQHYYQQQPQPQPTVENQYWYQEAQFQPAPTPINVSPESKEGVERALTVPVKLTMEKLSIAELEEREQPESLSPLEKAIRSLVNLDNIEEVKETPLQAKSRTMKEVGKSNKSKPMAPTKVDWNLSTNASLGEIKAKAPPREPQREVMRTHAFDPAAVQAGMMVVYGSSIPSQGFGAAVTHPFMYQQQQYVPQMLNM